MSQVCSQCGHISTQQEIADCAGGFIEGKHYCDKCFQQALYRKSQPPPMLIAQSKSKWPIWVSSVIVLLLLLAVFVYAYRHAQTNSPPSFSEATFEQDIVTVVREALYSYCNDNYSYSSITIPNSTSDYLIRKISDNGIEAILVGGWYHAIDRFEQKNKYRYICALAKDGTGWGKPSILMCDWIESDFSDSLKLWIVESAKQCITPTMINPSSAQYEDIKSWSVETFITASQNVERTVSTIVTGQNKVGGTIQNHAFGTAYYDNQSNTWRISIKFLE